MLCGCPLSDPYYLDPGKGLQGGRNASGGSAPSGGMSFTGGATASGGFTAGGSGGGSSVCDQDCKGKTCCDGTCVDLKADAQNCGACGDTCAAGRTCMGGACAGGWVGMAATPGGFESRSRFAATAFDGRWFVFGGINDDGDALNSGAIYDPKANKWTLVAIDAQTPSARQLAMAIWTGQMILVFGGISASGNNYYNNAALYDPELNRWTAAASATVPRAAGFGVHAGQRVLFAGGATTGAVAATPAEVYDVESDSWRTASAENAPGGMMGAAWAVGAGQLRTYGGLQEGSTRIDRGYAYEVERDTWSQLPRGLSVRSAAFGAFDGNTYFVWGGHTDEDLLGDGAYFSSSWTNVDSAMQPTLRWAVPRQGGWAFALGTGDFVVLGGENASGDLVKDGGRYIIGKGWTRVPAWPSKEEHSFGSASLVGKEVLIWGGLNGDSPTSTGERWSPP